MMCVKQKTFLFKFHSLACLLLLAGSLCAQHYPFLNYKQLSLGGTSTDAIMKIAPDAAGNFIIAGITNSPNGRHVRGKHGLANNSDWLAVKLNGITGDTIWISRALGGSADDVVRDAFPTSDGNYVLVGTTKSDDGDVRGWHPGYDTLIIPNIPPIIRPFSDFWAVKLNGVTGDTIWVSRALGGTGNEENSNGSSEGYGLSGCEGTDGNYLLAGITNSTDGDVRGKKGAVNFNDMWAIKFDKNTGDTLWTTRGLGGTRQEELSNAIATSDGHYLLCGHSSSFDGDVRGGHGSSDWWVVKLNGATGDTLWTSRGLGGSSQDYHARVIESTDGHYVLGGLTHSADGDVRGKHPGPGNNFDYWVVKLNRLTGDTIWTSRALGGSAVENGNSSYTNINGGFTPSICEGKDGHYVLASETNSTDGDIRGKHGSKVNTDWWAVKINRNTGDTVATSLALGGDSLGSTSVPASWQGMELFYHIEPTCDGGFLLSGTTRTAVVNGDVEEASPAGTTSSLWIVKLNSGLRKEWTKLWSCRSDPRIARAFPTIDGGYLFTAVTGAGIAGAKTVASQGGYDFWTSKVFWKDTLDANFTANTYTVCPRDTIDFTDISAGLYVDSLSRQWYWDFGDGDTSTVQHPQHRYVSLGTYTVTQIIGKECLFDTITRVITVLPPPTVNLGPDTTICLGDSILLDADPGNVIYFWSTGSTAQSIYVNTAGLVSATVTSLNNGCSADSSVTVTVAPLPVITVSGIPSFCFGAYTSLTANGANNYVWSPSAGLNVTSSAIVIANPASQSTYTIIGTDTNNCVSSSVLTVTVNIPPIAFAATDTSICEGENVILTASGGVSYLWDTGGSTANITVAPALTTTYSVSVSDGICADTAVATVTVNPLPAAAITGNSTITVGQSTTLSVTITTGGNYYYNWSPNTALDCDTCPVLSASPALTTTYSVTITDDNGCSTAAYITIIVEEMPCAGEDIFIPNAFSPNDDGENDVLKVAGPCLSRVDLIIYNRWGEIVFKSTNGGEYWDGKFRGKMLDTGVFTYRLFAVLLSGENYSGTGNIYLIR